MLQTLDGFNNAVLDAPNPMNVHPKFSDKHAETHETALH